MISSGWLTRSLADVPPADGWLGVGESALLAGLRFEKRRADWRLGRFAAKAAVAAWLDVAVSRLEVLAAEDGAPEVRLDGEQAPVALSLSHRAGRALAVVADGSASLGCDLELIESRSDAFINDWLTHAERATLAATRPTSHPLVANLLWTAKEAAAKLRREGLRVDLRDAEARPAALAAEGVEWRPVSISWKDGGGASGWWRTEPGWVMAVLGDPPPARPRALT